MNYYFSDKTTSIIKHHNTLQNVTTAGELIDVATGDYLQQWQLIDLSNSLLPLKFTCVYRSTSEVCSHLGQKWSDNWSQCLSLQSDSITFTDSEGVQYTFYTPCEPVFATHLHAPHYVLYGHRSHSLYLFDRNTQLTYVFERISTQLYEKRHLAWITDYFGNYIHFAYNEQGLQTVTHSDGYRLRVKSRDGLIRRVDYQGKQSRNLLRCEYNEARQLIYCHSHQFGEIYHEYDEKGLMTGWKDTQHTRAGIRYDNQGRVLSVRSAGGHYADRFEYDDENRLTHYYDAQGGVSRYWYNENDLVIKEEDPLGRIKETEWDLSRKVSETDALGRRTEYRYDETGNITEIALPNGTKAGYRYNGQGQLICYTAPHGRRWRYDYRENGALQAVTSPEGLTQRYHTNEKGRLIRTSYPDGTYSRYDYDEQSGRLKAVYNGRGEVTRMERDIFDRTTLLTLPDGSQYRYEYSEAHANPNGSLTKLHTPEGSVQQFSYNSERLLTKAIDGNGNKTKYGYGAFDLLEWQESPNGEKLHFSYDKLTRLTEVKNAQGDRYTYEYDKAGQLIAETDFAGNKKTYAYDQVGRLIRQCQGGIVEVFQYDSEDKLLKRQSWQAGDEQAVEFAEKFAKNPEKTTACSPLLHEVRYAYNKRGQLVKTENHQYAPFEATHVTEFEYDDQHRLIAEIQDGKRIEIELDKFGRQTGLQLPQGNENAVKLQQIFNRYGELEKLQVNNHNPLQFRYDKLGRQTEKRSQMGFYLAERFTPSGLLQAQGGGYDNDLTQQQLAHYQPQVQYPISGTQISRKWEYDNAFNLTATNDRAWDRTEYHSNKNGQVTAVFNDLSEEFFRYDAQQNLTYKARNDTLTNENWQIKQRNGRIVRFGDKTYKYDEFGRLKTKTETKQGFRPVSTYYRWNSQNQLVELVSPHTGIWRYEYDAFGRRISKYQIQGEEQPQPNQIINMPIRPNRDYWHKINELWDEQENVAKNKENPTACKGTKFLYHHNQLVAEIPLKVDDNTAFAEDWEEAVYWLYQNDDFTPTARLHKGELHYIVADQVGTITDLVSEKGYVHYQQKLNLWGNAETQTLHHQRASNDEIICNHRFVGQYWDEESGLHYNRFRYYNPETAQYLQSDPIGLLGGFNPYGYVGIPTAFVDPLGLNTCEPRSVSGLDPYKGVKKASEYLKSQSVPRKYRKQILESFDIDSIKVHSAGTNEYGLRYFDEVKSQAKVRYLFEAFSATRSSLTVKSEWNKMTKIAQF